MKNDNFATNLLLASVLFTLLVCTYSFFSYFDVVDKQNMEIQTQTEVISDLQNQIDTFGELAMIYPENRAMVVAVAYSESRCKKDVNHKDSHTKGIGGIKDLWKLECEPNSLMAIEEVIEGIREAHPNFSEYEIIKFYKGAKTNLSSTNITYEMYVALKEIM